MGGDVMILAIDGGLATFGWAVINPRLAYVEACGVLIQKPDPKLGVHADRQRRAGAQAALITSLMARLDFETFAIEEPSFAPRSSASAKIGIGMSWGVAQGLAWAARAELRVLPPKVWQRAIIPAEPGENPRAAIPYERVAAALEAYVDLRATGLDQIAKGQRNHAMDAIGIGVYAALRPVLKTTTTHATPGATP